MKGPSVILIGGQMTVDDGTSYDTRQELQGDEASEVMLRSLATSDLWWKTALSVANPILDEAGEGAFGLLLGPRSVIQLRVDGSTRRTSLRTLLGCRTGLVEIVRVRYEEDLPEGFEAGTTDGNPNGRVGFRTSDSDGRWRFLKGSEFYLTQVVGPLAPTVVIDNTPWYLSQDYQAVRFTDLELSRLAGSVTLIAPHTHNSDAYFTAYAQWLAAGRPADPPHVWEPPPEETPWDPDAPPDPVHYMIPVPISAAFAITGLIQNAQWTRPDDAEAARSLLEARYDLKIGLWDLASNATLRNALLEVTPVLPAPPTEATMPRAAAQRAADKVDAKMVAKAEEKRSLGVLSGVMGPLEDLGWIRGMERERWLFRLLMTETYLRDFGEEKHPLLQLELAVTKRSTIATAFTILYWAVDLPSYVKSISSALQGIADPEECPLDRQPLELWRSSGGWGDANVDWVARVERIAVMTAQWREALADFIEECRKAIPESWSRSR